jgi:hypothetical protein
MRLIHHRVEVGRFPGGLAYVGGDQLAVGITLNTLAGLGWQGSLCMGSAAYVEAVSSRACVRPALLLAVTSSRRFTWDLVFT